MSSFILRPLEEHDQAKAVLAHHLLAQDNFSFLFDWTAESNWGEFIEMTNSMTDGKNLPPDRVRSVFLIAVNPNNQIVGRVSVRYELNPHLLNFGGHIGYAVLPDFRRQGIATRLLTEGLRLLAVDGTNRALVTCFEENPASAAVIEKVDGKLEDKRVFEERLFRRYWIETNQFAQGNSN